MCITLKNKKNTLNEYKLQYLFYIEKALLIRKSIRNIELCVKTVFLHNRHTPLFKMDFYSQTVNLTQSMLCPKPLTYERYAENI